MKIPETPSPFRVIVNGVEYVYEAGSDVTVPEAVASVIRQMSNYPPEAPKPVSPIEETDPRLPEVTASDNDKVLTVEDGVWKAKTPSGGGSSGGVLVVTATESDGVFSCDKTAAEMWAAYPVIILYDATNNGVALCSSANKEDDSYEFAFPDSFGEKYYEAASGSDYPTYTPGE